MSQFDESKIRRDGEGKFASKGPSAEAENVDLSDEASAEKEYLDIEAHKGLNLIKDDMHYVEMDRAAEEERESRDVSMMDFDPDSAQKFIDDMTEFRKEHREDWDAYEEKTKGTGNSIGASYALARIGGEGFDSDDQELNHRLSVGCWDQGDLSLYIDDDKIYVE